MQTMLRDRHRQRWTPMASGPTLYLFLFFLAWRRLTCLLIIANRKRLSNLDR